MSAPSRANDDRRRPRIRDHRGRAVRLRHPRGASADEPREKPEVDWSFTIPFLGCLVVIGFGVALALTFLFVVVTGITGGAPVAVPLAVGGLATLIYFIAVLFILRRRRTRAAAEFAIAADLRRTPPRCPSCGYTLADLPPESDGCTVCPECGSAWRLSSPLPS